MDKIKKALAGLIVLFWLGFSLIPIIWIFLASIKLPKDIIGSPKLIFTPTFQNYLEIFSGGEYASYYLNTFIIVMGAIILGLVIGVPAAYAFARYNFRAKESIAFTILSFRFAPELAVLLPLFVIYRKFGLYNTYTGLILIYQLITLPLMVWMMRGFIEDIPPSIEEAAKVDGANNIQTFFKVVLPLIKPGLAATVVLCFIFGWNSFIFGLILSGRETMPITMGLLGFMGFNQVRWGPMAAATILGVLPQMIMTFLVLRNLIRGLTFGAVKG